MSDFIHKLAAKNYGCLKDVAVELTPLHAFIGPNDSGKSTLLRAIRVAIQFACAGFKRGEHDDLESPERTEPKPFHPGPLALVKPFLIEVTRRDVTYRLRDPGSAPKSFGLKNEVAQLFDVDEEILVNGTSASARRRKVGFKADTSALRSGPSPESLGDAYSFFMRGARLLRLDPDALREPSPLLTGRHGSKLSTFQDERGRGLAGVYDIILNQNIEAFLRIQEQVRTLFPAIKAIGLENVTPSTKVLQAQMRSGEWISARFLSEGLLYYLAFAALQHIARPAVLLIEEPENGLHPARIAEVMRVLRETSKETQVLIATHSPLIVNELKPEEVSVVTRDPEAGTKVTRLQDTPDFEARSKIYALGELWIAYANGKDEAPLLEGHEP